MATIAEHEAAHAAAAAMLDLPVASVSIEPDAQTLGRTFVLYSGEDAYRRAIVILCGMIETAPTDADLPTWPLRADRTTDERNLAALLPDEQTYGRAVGHACRLTLSPQYGRLKRAIARQLERTPYIGMEAFDRLVDDT